MSKSALSNEFLKLVEIVQTLCSPDGCEWDRAQTHKSLAPYLLEEAYEVIEAIYDEDISKLKEELGDLMLHIVFQGVLGEKEKSFSLEESIRDINSKLVRRHPHVFGKTEVKSVKDIKKNWEEIKLKEGRTSLMDGLPKTLPALLLAQRVQLRASEVGFDWDKVSDVWSKIYEEIEELKIAIDKRGKGEVKSELGDLLFSIVNLSRFLGIDPEEALRDTIAKFINRFMSIEDLLRSRGIKLSEATLSEMDEIWNRLKEQENPN